MRATTCSGPFPFRLPGPQGRPSLSVAGVPVTSSYSGIANRAQSALADGGKAAAIEPHPYRVLRGAPAVKPPPVEAT